MAEAADVQQVIGGALGEIAPGADVVAEQRIAEPGPQFTGADQPVGDQPQAREDLAQAKGVGLDDPGGRGDRADYGRLGARLLAGVFLG